MIADNGYNYIYLLRYYYSAG